MHFCKIYLKTVEKIFFLDVMQTLIFYSKESCTLKVTTTFWDKYQTSRLEHWPKVHNYLGKL